VDKINIRRRLFMKVKDIMTKNVTTVNSSASVEEISKIMKNLNVGSVPVVDGNRVVGIVTDRDIVLRDIAMNKTSEHLKASDIMSKGISTVTPETDVEQAAQLMAERQLRRLPVINNNMEIVGIVALGDIAVSRKSDEAAGEALTDISKSDDTLTTKQIVQFKEKPLTVSFVYKYGTMELQDITVEHDKSKSNMSMNIWICIGIAAIALSVILLVVFGIRSAIHSKDKQEPSGLSAKIEDNQVVNQISQREQVDLELTAVIAAAISAATGTPVGGFVVRSIKRR
jgi:CBS domain-containing protein